MPDAPEATPRTTLRFLLDDRLVELENPSPTQTILAFLRSHPELTGTKEGCGEGDCGACTVALGELVDGELRYRSVNACIQLLATLDGKQLRTIEHLGQGEQLDGLQSAMVDCHGSQCGFCTPGIVMSLWVAAQTRGRLERAQTDAALAGNLCRCTGYGSIIDAAARGSVSAERHNPAQVVEQLRALAKEDTPFASSSARHAFIAPRCLDTLLHQLEAEPESIILSGGTDVGLWLTKRIRPCNKFVYLGRVRELERLEVGPQGLEIGAGVSLAQCVELFAEHIPELARLLERFASPQIRSVATLVGNLANASPIGDMAPALMALDAKVHLASVTGRRSLPLADYFIAYGEQNRRAEELIEFVEVPFPKRGDLLHIHKLSKRRDQDISSVLGAFWARIDRHGRVIAARLCYGGMAGTPSRATLAEQALIGASWGIDGIEAARQALNSDFQPLSDLRGSAHYRGTAAGQLLLEFYARFSTEPGSPRPLKPTVRPRVQRPTLRGPSMCTPDSPLPVGRAMAHDSAGKHVTGQARYVDDIPKARNLLYAHIITSRIAHASIDELCPETLKSNPGIVRVLTAEDIPGTNDFSHFRSDDDRVFAQGEIDYYGQAIACVLAESLDLARDVGWHAGSDPNFIRTTQRPAILDIDDAIAQGAFAAPALECSRGDTDAALARAPHRIRGRLRCGGQEHFYLEPQVALAIPGEDGAIHIHTCTQDPSALQHIVARILNLPDRKITVEVRRLGGGFGGKETITTQFAAIAALGAKKTGRPVHCLLDRDEDMRLTGKRHAFRFDYEVGFDDSGRILGLRMRMASLGGYSLDQSLPVMQRALFGVDNAYFLENVELTGLVCRTNTCTGCAFRGFGTPQAQLAIERIMDEIAGKLGHDGLQVRRRNFYGPPPRHITHYDWLLDDDIIVPIVDALAHRCDYDGRRQAVAAFNARGGVLRRGLALMPLKYGVGYSETSLNRAGALIHIYRDGSVFLNHGGTEMGQGLFQKVAQVVATELAIDPDTIEISATRTDKVPNTVATAASSGADMNGRAAQIAARKLRRRLTRFAAEHFGVDGASIEFRAGRVHASTRSLSFAELAGAAIDGLVELSATGHHSSTNTYVDPKTQKGRAYHYNAYGAALSEVEIDSRTGELRVLAVDILHDVGRSLNPALDLGQVEGGFIQGMGWLTTEELVWDPQGALSTHAPSTYKIPVCSDRPAHFETELCSFSANGEATPFRSKAVGEPPLLLAISVFSAVRDALSSLAPPGVVPKLDAPATPERILMACRALEHPPG